jgi:guanine deaminase
VRVGLGTDVGGGTSLSQLQSLNEAYKVVALSGAKLDAIRAFYLATLGGARALYLDDRLGQVAAGFDADLVVLDPRATPLLDFRTGYCEGIEELLFTLMTLGDDRAIRATRVAGENVYDRDRTGGQSGDRPGGQFRYAA